MLREINEAEMMMVSGGTGLLDVRANTVGMKTGDTNDEGWTLQSWDALNIRNGALSGGFFDDDYADCEDALTNSATIVGATAAVIGGVGTLLTAVPHAYAQGAGKVLQGAAAAMGVGAGGAVIVGCAP